jgi:hypothetical protein
MDIDDALPPPIRRSPRAALEARKQRRDYRTFIFDDVNTPIAPTRSASTNSHGYNEPTLQESVPDVNPLQSHPVDAPPPRNLARKYSYPLLQLEQEPEGTTSPDPAPLIEPPTSRRHPRGLVSYRNNKRELKNMKKLPPHLRRQTSLETINSVTTTASDDQSEDAHDPPEAEAPSSEWYNLEDDSYSNPPPSIMSKSSSTHSSAGSSRQSITPVETPLGYASLDHHTPQSLFRKMLPRKLSDKTQAGPPSPTRLVIEKTTSIDRSSSSITLSGSTSSPSEEYRSLHSILEENQRHRSGSKSSGSSKWSASDFDISTLSEAEMKRCKKKGINPALYAEMRAAKKGKWTSPIAGNTFL